MYRYNPIIGNLDLVPQSVIGEQYIIYVNSLANLPTPVNNEIYLNTGKMYFFLTMVDLQGITLHLGNVVLQGISQELAGVENGHILITATATLSSFRLNNCTMEINYPQGAYDWTHINFYDCTSIVVTAADNIVLDTIGFINTYGVVINGSLNSFVLAPNCIFRSVINPTAVFFRLSPTAVINRRLRIQDSVFQTDLVGQTSILVEAGAMINTESFILKTVRFTGPGTAVSGINGDDDRAFFFEAVGTGVINSTAVANMYMKNNTIPTLVVAGGNSAMAGVTEFGPIFQKFTHNQTENSLVYTSIVQRIFTVRAAYTVFSGSNNIIGMYIAIARAGNPINPTTDVIEESEMYTTTGGARPENSVVQAIVTLNQGDRVYCVVENTTNNVDVTIGFFNMIIEKTAV